jgi:phospholipid transport system substrate-binding protein
METRRRGLPVRQAMAIVAALLLYAAGGATEPVSPTEGVRSTINEVIRLLNDESLKRPEHLAQRHRLVEEAVGRRFDYEELSKRSLGGQWTKLTDIQRREFVEVFKQLLSDAYADRIEGYSGEQVRYLKERIEGSYAQLKTRIVSAKFDLPVDYRLLNKEGEWRVYDVVIDGVSLVKNYRGQFERILRASSYEELVLKMRTKSEEIKTHQPKS